MKKRVSRFATKALSSKAGRNMLASYFSFFSTAAWAFISIPLAVKYLDKASIGLWTVINAILGYLTWMDFGVSIAAGRILAPAVAKGDQEEANQWWTVISRCLQVQALLILVVGSIATPFVVDFFDVGDDLRTEAIWTLLIGVVLFATALPLRKYPGLFMAQERFHWVPLILGFVPWCNLLIFGLLLMNGVGLKSYVVALAGGQAMNWIMYRLVARRGQLCPTIDGKGLSWERIKKVFSLGSGLMFFQITENFLVTLPNILVSKLGGLATVPIYNFSFKGPRIGQSLASRTYQSFQPAWQRHFVNGDFQEFKRCFDTAGMFTIAIGTFAAAGVILLNPVLVNFLAGTSYLPPAELHGWFALAAVTTPFGIYLQSLATASGSLGKLPLTHLVRVAFAIPASWLSWQAGGLEGVACFFAYLPVFNILTGYLMGNRRCGFTSASKVGTKPIIAILLPAIVLNLYVVNGADDGLLDIGQTGPLTPSVICALILALIGVSYFALGLKTPKSK